MCNHVSKNKDNSISSSKTASALFYCLGLFPMNPKFVNVILSLKKISLKHLDFLFKSNGLSNFVAQIVDGLNKNIPDEIISILLNWKKITKLILRRGWEKIISSSKLKYLKPPFILTSAIFSQDHLEYKNQNFELIKKFKQLPIEKGERIQTILKKIINLISPHMNEKHEIIKSFNGLIYL